MTQLSNLNLHDNQLHLNVKNQDCKIEEVKGLHHFEPYNLYQAYLGYWQYSHNFPNQDLHLESNDQTKTIPKLFHTHLYL